MKSHLTLSVLILTSLLHLTSCGVLLYPERQGQARGRIDPAVAILDGIGVVLFVIPGLLAFLIDFHQGTIYLPSSHGSNQTQDTAPQIIKVEGKMDQKDIETIIGHATGSEINLNGPGVIASAVDRSLLALNAAALANLAL